MTPLFLKSVMGPMSMAIIVYLIYSPPHLTPLTHTSLVFSLQFCRSPSLPSLSLTDRETNLPMILLDQIW